MKLCLCAGCFLQNIDSTTSKFSKQALKALKARPRGTQFSRHCRWDLPLTELSGAIVDPVPKRSLGSEFPRSCLHWSSLVFLVHFQILLFTIPSFSLLLSLLLFASLLLSSLVFSCLLYSFVLFSFLFYSSLLLSYLHFSLYPSCSYVFSTQISSFFLSPFFFTVDIALSHSV